MYVSLLKELELHSRQVQFTYHTIDALHPHLLWEAHYCSRQCISLCMLNTYHTVPCSPGALCCTPSNDAHWSVKSACSQMYYQHMITTAYFKLPWCKTKIFWDCMSLWRLGQLHCLLFLSVTGSTCAMFYVKILLLLEANDLGSGTPDASILLKLSRWRVFRNCWED